MKNLTAAILLALLFCNVSTFSEEISERFNQNPEYSLPSSEPAKPAGEAAKQPEKTDARFISKEPDKKDRPTDKTQTAYSAGMPKKSRPLNQSYRGSLWEDELKDWEKRNSPVPQSLPRATFPLQRRSFSTSKSCRRTFRSSSPKIIRVKTSSCCQKTTKVTCRSCR